MLQIDTLFVNIYKPWIKKYLQIKVDFVILYFVSMSISLECVIRQFGILGESQADKRKAPIVIGWSETGLDARINDAPDKQYRAGLNILDQEDERSVNRYLNWRGRQRCERHYHRRGRCCLGAGLIDGDKSLMQDIIYK